VNRENKDTPQKEGFILYIGGLSNRPSSSVFLWTHARRSIPGLRVYLWITKNIHQAESRAKDLRFFLDEDVMIFPDRFTFPFVHMLPDIEVSTQRIAVLTEILEGTRPVHIVAPVRAIMEYTIPRKVLHGALEYIETGEEIDRDALLGWLLSTGYERCHRVERPGEFSERGEILDIFPPGTNTPLRLDFFGDLLEEIRGIDPHTQRSFKAFHYAVLAPAMEAIALPDCVEHACTEIVKRAEEAGWSSEQVASTMEALRNGFFTENIPSLLPVLYEGQESILNYLKEDCLIILDDPVAMMEEVETLELRARMAYEDSLERKVSPIASLDEYVMPKELLLKVLNKRHIVVAQPRSPLQEAALSRMFKRGPAHKPKEYTEKRSVEPPSKIMLLSRVGKGKETLYPLFDHLKAMVKEGHRIIIAASGERAIKRLFSLFETYGFKEICASSLDIPITGLDLDPGVYLVKGELSAGFSVKDEGITFLSEAEFLGHPSPEKKGGTHRRTTQRIIGLDLQELAPGDMVVHRDHGIGVFQGLVTIEAGGIKGEYLLIEYRDGDKLYCPVDRIALIQKYNGLDKGPPRLDKLGSASWVLTKTRIKKAILDIANELVELYALRKVERGHAFSPPDTLYREFEAGFQFEDTLDQEKATVEIFQDMETPRPMDRLLCGDVGYGKTEVAMRAAFKAVEDGKQVGVLVPTTLLAEQHERTFRERFSRFPVRIAAISRLKTRKEQREILEALRSGRLDIIIGTHRLLQPDCSFKDLGLLIVDEEHRFGVRHKERLKQLKKNVDCLSLTATPIPRTLQLSLLGIRDLTIIATPPKDRLPVKTFLSEFDPPVIKDAFYRELERDGQIFFVYNRIKGIYRMAERLKALIPEARIDVAHGQMDAMALEDTMIRFIRGETDCLVCTTIIESGLDIPSANTLLVYRADTLGLAQLYQLRGRVGRSREQAYAYLLVPDIGRVPKDARKRLTAVLEMEEREGGLTLAMEDLKIRGAGNLLGTAQSGQIAKVGYDLYLELLKEAVDELKGIPHEEAIHPEVNLKIPAFIPEDYCKDVAERLRLYRRIGQCKGQQQISEAKSWLEDCYGPIPEELENLFEITELKGLLRQLGCIRMDEQPAKGMRKVMLAFGSKGPLNLAPVLRLVRSNGLARLYPDGRLSITFKDSYGDQAFLAKVKGQLQQLV